MDAQSGGQAQQLFSKKAVWVVLSVTAFLLGLMLGARYFGAAMSEKRQLVKTSQSQLTRLAELQRTLVGVQSAATIDKRSLQQVQQSLSQLQLQLANAEEELWLYRHLLQDKADNEGAFSSTIKLSAGPPDEVAYKLLVYQNSNKKNRQVSISYMLTVKGDKNGLEEMLPVHNVDKEVGARTATFKYFHVEEGRFQLPDKFVPESIEVRIWKDEDVSTVTTQIIPWQIAETDK